MADGKWHGVVTDIVAGPIDKVWPLLAEFDGLHRNFPEIFTSCDTVEGESNKVGSVRALSAPRPDGKGVVEATERLTHNDDVNHTTSYMIEKVNFGWTGYKADIAAKSTESGGTSVVWSFEVNPVSGLTEAEYGTPQQGLFQAIINLVKAKVAE